MNNKSKKIPARTKTHWNGWSRYLAEMNYFDGPIKGTPLKGKVVIDCSSLRTGPFVCKLLADLGATVIKIENPNRLDPSRKWPGVFKALNSNKRLVQLDLTQILDQKKFSNYLKKADLLIESFRPQTKVKLGIDSKNLSKIAPKLKTLSLVAFPKNSPWHNRPMHDLGFQALSGTLSRFSSEPGLPLADLFTAFWATLNAVLLINSKSTQKRNHLEISFFEALFRAQCTYRHEFLENPTKTTGFNKSRTLITGLYPCYRIYHCKDGQPISVSALEAKYWKNLCKALDLRQFETQAYPDPKHAPAIHIVFEKKWAEKTWPKWQEVLGETECCVEPVLNYSDIYVSS